MKNTVISPNILLCKFCGKAQFPHSFGRFARNYAETVFAQNFHTRKLGDIIVFFAALVNCGYLKIFLLLMYSFSEKMIPLYLLTEEKRNFNVMQHATSSTPNQWGGYRLKEPKFVVGSKFSNYMGKEVGMRWRHVKVLFGGEAFYFWK